MQKSCSLRIHTLPLKEKVKVYLENSLLIDEMAVQWSFLGFNVLVNERALSLSLRVYARERNNNLNHKKTPMYLLFKKFAN